MNELKDKIAIITGGFGDIGTATVFKFIEEGAKAIVIADLDITKAEKIIRKIKLESCCNCIVVKTDVSNYNDIKKLLKTSLDNFGTLDILVNCAGICPIATLEEIGEKEWDKVMAVNLKSVYLCSREAIAIMKENKSGKIVNISSVAGRMGGIATSVNYATSKGGIITLTMSLAKLCGPYNINVNCIAPGTIDSEMTKTWSEEKKQSILRNIPLGRLGMPADVADVISFLASERSNYMTGAIVDVNGGLFTG
jgi:3-oxoacyl-[acyl-carrier protein] reductase